MPQQHAKSAIIPLFTVILIDALGWGIIYPILEPILLKNAIGLFPPGASLALRSFWYGAMIGIYMLCMFLTSPLLGSLSDRYGRKIILTLSMLGNATGFLVSGIGLSTHSLALIVFGRVIAGATAGSLPIAQAAMMDISSNEDKPKRLSLIALANVSGFALGPVLGSICLDKALWGNHISYSTPFWVTMLIGILGATLIQLLFKETFHGNPSQKIKLYTGITNLYEAIIAPNTQKLCLVFSCFLLAWVAFFSLLPILLSEKFHWEASSIGYFISFTAVALGISVVLIIPRLMKLMRIEMIILLSLSALLLCTILFPLISNQVFFWITIILTISVPFAYIGLTALFSNAVNQNEQGKIMGVISSLAAFNWGVGPLIIGYIASLSFNLAYIFTGTLFLFAIILFARNFFSKTIRG